MIEIPVRTLKNVVVAVRDCFTGNLLEKGALVTVPEDAPRLVKIYLTHSGYQSVTQHPVNRYSDTGTHS